MCFWPCVFHVAQSNVCHFRGQSKQGGATTHGSCFLLLIWLNVGHMRCHPRRPAPAAMRRNIAFLMVRMVRFSK